MSKQLPKFRLIPSVWEMHMGLEQKRFLTSIWLYLRKRYKVQFSIVIYNMHMMESVAPIVQMGASRQIVHVHASFIFPCTIKSMRWQAVMDEVDKECSDFCVIVGTVTGTVGILIHCWLRAGRLADFWFG